MNCRDAETQIFAARDAPLGAADAAVLEQHLQACPQCRRLAAGLTAAASSWRERDQAVTVPDARSEWHAVRRQIRSAAPAQKATAGLPSWQRLWRFALPLAGAGALAIGMVNLSQTPPATPAESTIAAADWSHFEDHFTAYARAEYVETENEDVSPFVYLDEESGWLIVWASDLPENPSI